MATNEDLIRRLESEHPTYSDLKGRLGEIRDVIFDQVGDKTDEYLPRGTHESTPTYELRKKLSRFKAETPGIIQRLVSAVFSEAPSRPKELVNRQKALVENADGCGLHLNEFLEDRLFSAVAFGASLTLVDMPAVDQDGMVASVTSKGFSVDKDLREVSDKDIRMVPYDLDQMINWSVDSSGEFNWIRLRHVEHRQLSPEEEARKIEVYREIDRTSWRIFEVTQSKEGKKVAEEVGNGDHNLGMVPVAILWIGKESDMRFVSMIRFAYHYDIQNYQEESDLRYDTFMHAHPTLKRYADRESAKKMEVGANAVVDLDPQMKEEAEYMEYPTKATDEIRKNIMSNLESLRRVSGLDPLGTMETSQAFRASGTARRTSFNVTESRHLVRYSRRLQTFEGRLWEISERWKDPDPERRPDERMNEYLTIFPRVFTNIAPDSMIESWQESRVGINSDKFDRLMQRKIITTLIPDISSEDLEEILNEVESNELVGKIPPNEAFVATDNTADEASNAVSRLESLRRDDVEQRSQSASATR